jgi:hypothetical protein
MSIGEVKEEPQMDTIRSGDDSGPERPAMYLWGHSEHCSGQLTLSGVAVEKLTHPKMAKKTFQ